jgi:gliding motility-associated lipoprotein GldD
MIRVATVSIVLSIIIITAISCEGDYSPRPTGYFRIDFPEKSYTLFESDCPYTFMYPEFARIVRDVGGDTRPCWLNIDFPGYNGRLHISYMEVNNNLVEYLEDSRKLAFKHSVKADAIDERVFVNNEERVYGTLYDIKGNSASAVQFYLTDSSRHFFRGALYFSVQPNRDSLAPVIEYFRDDILYLIESFSWN